MCSATTVIQCARPPWPLPPVLLTTAAELLALLLAPPAAAGVLATVVPALFAALFSVEPPTVDGVVLSPPMPPHSSKDF